MSVCKDSPGESESVGFSLSQSSVKWERRLEEEGPAHKMTERNELG